jgi:predicted MPP superfamily phosphohydrolase
MIRRYKSIINLIISILIVFSIFNSSTALEFEINSNINNILTTPIFQNAIENDDRYKIIYPLSTTPALVEKNSDLIINFKADEFEEIYVIISTAYEPIKDEFLLENITYWQENSVWNIQVNIPSSIPEELYNITLFFENDDISYKSNQARSLKVYTEFSDDFSFIHIADIHYGDPRGLVESIEETIGFKSIKRCIKEVNLLQPDFVLISGDIVFGQLYPFEYRTEYKKCYELLQTFDVPTFLVPGNHDGYNRILEDGFDFWQEYFGPLNYSFNYGKYHFTAVNSFDMSKLFRLTFLFIPLNWGGSITDVQLNWIKNDLEAYDSKLNFLFLHHNPLWDTSSNSLIGKSYENREELLSLIFENEVDMVLAGHNHLDTVNIENNVIFITTTTPESEISTDDGYWGYRLIEIVDGEIFSYNYKEPKYSIPSYQIDYKIKIYDDFAEIFVNNSLEINIDAYLKFLMPKGSYNVENGEIIMQRDNEENSEIYIKSNIKSLTNESINIFKI